MYGQKRKHDSRNEPRFNGQIPNKKQRPGNGASYNEGHYQVLPSKSSLPVPLPPLPDIKPHLAKAVFTHSSIAAQKPDDKTMVNYERLEFLGDAHLELMASEVIFERYTSAAPGKMSALRELLCRNEVWAGFSQAYELDQKINHSGGLEQTKEWKKIAADIFEAYIAAIVVSDDDKQRGYETAKSWVTALWEPKLAEMGMAIVETNIVSKEELAKTVLVPGVKLNYLQEKPPLVDKAHGKQTYYMAVHLNGWGYDSLKLGSGSGESKNAASQSAAKEALRNPKLNEIRTKRALFLEEREQQKAKEAEAERDKLGKDGEEGEVGEVSG